MADINFKQMRQTEIDFCSKNVQYFVEQYGHIEDKDADQLIQPFKLWDEQKAALQSIIDNKWNVILKARQLGFTWLILHIVAWMMICNTGRTIIGMSRTEEEAKELVRRLAIIFRYMPAFIAEEKFVPKGWTGATFRVTSLELTINYHEPSAPLSIYKVFPSSPGACRSFTADLIMFDEWAFQEFAREIWTGAFPVINSAFGRKVIGLSTIERGSLFEEIFVDEKNGFNKIFIPWSADPKRDKEWYDNTKRALGDKITQEYPATIEEALEVPGGAFFPEICEEFHITDEPLVGNVIRYVALDYGLDTLSVHWIAVDSYGNAQAYKELDIENLPISSGCREILDMIDEDEVINNYLGPDDLGSRDQLTGKPRTTHFYDAGIDLLLTTRNKKAGCASMKEWLKPPEDVNEKAKFTILKNTCPNLWNSLKKIQKNKRNPDVYESLKAHELTHDLDSIRCFCVFWTRSAERKIDGVYKKWTQDQWEDYNNAKDSDKKYLIKKYGEPL